MAVENENESVSMGIFVLRLHLGSPEPPRGTISALGAAVTQPFYGWIELMSAINTLRGWENLEPGERLPPEASSYSSGTEHRPDFLHR
jgi:hypothetical protein